MLRERVQEQLRIDAILVVGRQSKPPGKRRGVADDSIVGANHGPAATRCNAERVRVVRGDNAMRCQASVADAHSHIAASENSAHRRPRDEFCGRHGVFEDARLT
jgi:hypothetical protein